MDRITIKYNEHYVPKEMCTINRNGEADDCIGCNDTCTECEGNCEVCHIMKAFDRLGEYEDTGLTADDMRLIDTAYFEQARELSIVKRENEKLKEKIESIRRMYEK